MGDEGGGGSFDCSPPVSLALSRSSLLSPLVSLWLEKPPAARRGDGSFERSRPLFLSPFLFLFVYVLPTSLFLSFLSFSPCLLLSLFLAFLLF